MNKINHEIELLRKAAESGELPGYRKLPSCDSFYSESVTVHDLTEYFSGENDVLEQELNALWSEEPELKKMIPMILAAVEKSRAQNSHALERSELYNYTM